MVSARVPSHFNWPLLIVVEEIAVDLGIRLCWGKATAPRVGTVSDIFQLKKDITLLCSRVLCLSVLPCAVRAVHKCDFSLVANEIRIK